jgi:hypothetical protein
MVINAFMVIFKSNFGGILDINPPNVCPVNRQDRNDLVT